MVDESAIRQRYEAAKQGHVFAYYDTLSSEDQKFLLQQLDSIPVENMADLFQSAMAGNSSSSSNDSATTTMVTIEPFSGSNMGSYLDEELSTQCSEIGLQSIARGEVAALVLAGGQGTRLGFDGPKGMYDIQLPSHHSLFQMMVERLIKLQKLATAVAKTSAASSNDQKCLIPFYIMTSPINHEATTSFFAKHDYFGYGVENIRFFTQGMLPCFTKEGKMILETPSRVAMSPDGNGGIYPALQKSGSLQDMQQRVIRYLHVFSIDNALVKPADPVFVGFCIHRQVPCGNKSTWKSHAHEKVGVIALRNQRPCVVEYSEITNELAERVDATTGKLLLGAGNICNHFYTLDFLQQTVVPQMNHLFHVAHKKIPYYDDTQQKTVTPISDNNGIKLETFIFDVFPLVAAAAAEDGSGSGATQFAVWEVDRAEEFAPVKNAPGAASDSPDTARILRTNQVKRWLTAAGANLVQDENNKNENNNDSKNDLPCEISPLLSYAGEDLESYQGQTITIPFYLKP